MIASPRPVLLEVADLCVAFGSGPAERLAVREVSLSVRQRETVALVGESGSGKSLTVLAIVKLTPPGSHVRAGTLRLGDTDMRDYGDREMRGVRGRKVAIVFQNPMSALNPVLTVGHQITESLKRHKRLRGRAARDRAVELLEMVELPDAARRAGQYPHQMSGGMQQRAMIAIALSTDPQLLIADEPTTALDVTVQAQVLELLKRLQHQLGMSMIVISHDLAVVADMADEVNVMYAGGIVEHGSARDLFAAPAHPYTQAMLRTVEALRSKTTVDLSPIPGAPPGMGAVMGGCPFAPRCDSAFERCLAEAPRMRPVGFNHDAACHLASPHPLTP